eukprot:CAMPEP_0172538266 /NCGR_PEP_ID=MMETSP1067-20121228/9689_1 /TAXON_ID=265564 ORGANISM="Thalassiosira punctigera, Strain Tpunct2005C2" /NCGR_SAMPLE_ID=MMETSP1067 /ASSEMBLY_ACC=CAM_ASM_000444 /LENGTH=92 /DNA_ID=CAMNT_0013323727 /DNA_START=8 /DNA_END=283 /DNA_ORIENTATION=+
MRACTSSSLRLCTILNEDARRKNQEDVYILFHVSACVRAKQPPSSSGTLLHGAEHHRRFSAPTRCSSSSVERRCSPGDRSSSLSFSEVCSLV